MKKFIYTILSCILVLSFTSCSNDNERGCLKIELRWPLLFYLTLSKILCKWKQDSAVSLFLYLDSVFKNKHKLVHNQAPV